MKTSELIGPALDWAVAKCSETPYYIDTYKGKIAVMEEHGDLSWKYAPSTNWAQGGPIIEREKINTKPSINGDYWVALDGNPSHPYPTVSFTGPTPLISAMRCYVASKLGEEVDVPEELK